LQILFISIIQALHFDGLILWLFAAAKLGIPSPPAYLSVSQNVDTLLKGVNYASGGAGILNDTGLYFVSMIQVLIFLFTDYNLSDFSSNIFSIF